MKKKRLIENLYDMAETKDENGISKFDEQKLKRYLDGNNKLFRNNKDVFLSMEPKAKTCKMYNPCPICSKCLNKASHLYVKCQTCNIPICVHRYADRSKMIKRKNFEIKVSKETMKKITEGLMNEE